jgi:hypothetical protein
MKTAGHWANKWKAAELHGGAEDVDLEALFMFCQCDAYEAGFERCRTMLANAAKRGGWTAIEDLIGALPSPSGGGKEKP